MRIFGFIAFLVLACGCSQTLTSATRGTATQTPLGRELAGADRIVITNLDAPIIKQFQGFSLTLSGKDASKVVGDVSQMYGFSSTTPPTMRTDSIFDWELKFYRGTNYLTSIRMASSTFEYGNDEFGGDTGALKALSDRLLKLTTPPEER